MSNEIQLYEKLNDPLNAIVQLGTMFARSGMFGCDKAEQGQVLAMICLAERKSPVAITRDYDIVEGKLRKKALAALADFRAVGGKHQWISSGDEATPNPDDRRATLKLTDREANTITYSYGMGDAKAEGLIREKSRWTKRPGNMLRARCISNGLGMLCPEIFAGDDGVEDERESATLSLGQAANVAPVDFRPPVVDAEVVLPKEQSKPATCAETGSACETSSSPAASSSAPVAETPNETVEAIGSALVGHYLHAEKWLVKENWLTGPATPSTDEAHAAFWLQSALPKLSEKRCAQILKKVDAFIRAITPKPEAAQ